MLSRVVSFLFLLMICTSCNYFSSHMNNTFQEIDSIIDFSKVDVSPSFEVCDKLIDDAKTNCFRTNMHHQMAKYLQDVQLTIKEPVNTVVIVVLNINNEGNVTLKKIKYPPFFIEKNITIGKEVNKAINNLPKLAPAIKRGVPVATEYKLPINIVSK
ncbi:hypothetical protein C7447_1011085 [Tenacibaculum adriaticum]|uniref:TonB-like protein n=1 Tax=Tenacibaculum adriaticum TaxID=413713 RepID=A0A5S5DZ00_9FLAO|nr:hypothetical protein [Tenacibaculum adriaticum]TYQ00469.1 hypothetical protein C7447_1011085 [Tenacibaculum adriaticum]